MDRLVSKYTDVSAIGDEFTVPTLGSTLNYLTANLEVQSNRYLFKIQKLCSICGIELKERLALKKKNKKKHCKYCYTAVCVNCSPFKVQSQDNEKKKRVCMACFNSTLKNYFRMTVGPRPESPGIENMKNDKDYLDIIKNEVKRRKSEVRDIDKEIESEVKTSSIKGNEQNDLEKAIKILKESLKKESEELEYLGKLHKSNIEKMKKLKKHIDENECFFKNKVSVPGSNRAIGWSYDSVTDILQDQIAMSYGLKNMLLHDIQKLRIDVLPSTTKSCILF